MNKATSFWQGTWQRLQLNKGALAGLILIFIAVAVALLGYFLAPDPSPYANRIILEIGGRKPGFTQTFLQVKKGGTPPQTNMIERAVYGRRDAYDWVPISSWQQSGDSVVVHKYIDEDVTEQLRFSTAALAPQ